MKHLHFHCLALVMALAGPFVERCSAQSYGGFIDEVDCGQLSGWAWDSTQPNTPISVSIFSDNVLLTSGLAGNWRADLQAAGIGNGYHAWTILTPASIK